MRVCTDADTVAALGERDIIFLLLALLIRRRHTVLDWAEHCSICASWIALTGGIDWSAAERRREWGWICG